jgi:hypothetical protein
MAIAIAVGDNKLDDAFAKKVLEILVPVYPNHGWHVECKGGVLIIKHLEASGYRGLIGMLRKLDQLPNSAKALQREIVRAGGELLERANLVRGPRGDDPVTSFEMDDKKLDKYWHAPVHQRIIH